jgi:hypothetical protein
MRKKYGTPTGVVLASSTRGGVHYRAQVSAAGQVLYLSTHRNAADAAEAYDNFVYYAHKEGLLSKRTLNSGDLYAGDNPPPPTMRTSERIVKLSKLLESKRAIIPTGLRGTVGEVVPLLFNAKRAAEEALKLVTKALESCSVAFPDTCPKCSGRTACDSDGKTYCCSVPLTTSTVPTQPATPAPATTQPEPVYKDANGFEVDWASVCEVGLLYQGEGVRTWWATEFNNQLPEITHPTIQASIKTHLEYIRATKEPDSDLGLTTAPDTFSPPSHSPVPTAPEEVCPECGFGKPRHKVCPNCG